MKMFSISERKKALKEETNRIVKVLIKAYTPEKIILFGSMVQGKIHEWTDIDLLIIKKTTKRPIERCLEVARLVKPKIGIDLFIYTPKEYEMLLMEKYSFLLSILKRGKVCYEKRG